MTRINIYDIICFAKEINMNLVEHIKEFLKKQGLNWNGEIEYKIKTKKGKVADFRQAESSDFEKEGEQQIIIIDFKEDGQIALEVSIDLMNFKILGTALDFGLTCYAGEHDKNIKLCRERDLSNEWLKYLLVNGGLVYRTAIKNILDMKKQEAEQYLNKRIGDLDRKIGYLEKKKDYEKQSYEKKISNLKKLEKKVDSIEM